MPELMRHYGAAILATVTAGALFVLLFSMWPSGSGSFLETVGSGATGQLAGREKTGGGTAAFDEHAERTKPLVAFDGAFLKGTQYANMTSEFTIMDSDGGQWDPAIGQFVLDGVPTGGHVTIKALSSEADGVDYVNGANDEVFPRVTFDKATNAVLFHSQGLYLVSLEVLDGSNVRADYKINVIVDKTTGGEG